MFGPEKEEQSIGPGGAPPPLSDQERIGFRAPHVNVARQVPPGAKGSEGLPTNAPEERAQGGAVGVGEELVGTVG